MLPCWPPYLPPAILPFPTRQVPQCERLVQEMGGFLTRARPGTSFSTLEGEPWEDWARLVYAPVAFRDSQSSFGLWSTLSSTGLVFAPPMYSTSETCLEDEDFVAPYVDESYRWAGDLDPWVRHVIHVRCSWRVWGCVFCCWEPIHTGACPGVADAWRIGSGGFQLPPLGTGSKGAGKGKG